MVKSMTGYGRGECSYEGGSFTIEVRSVNNRYLDCGIKMPRAYIFAEDAMKARVQATISRGKVDVFVTQTSQAEDDSTVVVNEGLAKSYISALAQLYQLGGGQWVKGSYTATDLARFPDVLTVEKKEQDQEQVKAGLLGALDAALSDFDAMRVREGQRLAQDILGRTATIEQLVSKVEERSPQTVAEYRARLEAKMAEILQIFVDEGLMPVFPRLLPPVEKKPQIRYVGKINNTKFSCATDNRYLVELVERFIETNFSNLLARRRR